MGYSGQCKVYLPESILVAERNCRKSNLRQIVHLNIYVLWVSQEEGNTIVRIIHEERKCSSDKQEPYNSGKQMGTFMLCFKIRNCVIDLCRLFCLEQLPYYEERNILAN